MLEIKRIFNYLKKRDIIFIIILTLISTISSVFIPYIIGYIIDNINKNIFNPILVLITLYILSFIISIFNNHIIINMSENALYKIRKDVFNHLEKLPITYFDKNDKGNIMSIITNDIDKINDCLGEGITSIINGIIVLIGVTIMMFYMNILLSIIVIITVPLFLIIIIKMSKRMNEYFIKQQEILGNLTTSTEEIVNGIKTIKNINRGDYFKNNFSNINKKYRDISIKSSTFSYLVLPINIIINNLSNILIIGIGSILVVKGNIKIGNIIAFLSYASMFRDPINNLASMSSVIGEAIAGSKRIFKIIDYKIDNRKLQILTNLKGKIEFKNVSFKYENKYVLKNINFTLKPNNILALIGENGSGKTTITNLIVKFYSINKGNILIDDIDINQIDEKYLRDNIGLVLQETFLFKGTIMENIKYGLKIDDNSVIKVCKKIGIDNLINRFSNGYNTVIDYDNSNLSVGEKQLISIARCIVKNPKIVILDEATSEVDIRTEKYIYKGINELLKNRTSIVIAHRLSTIKSADNIIVLNNGKIVESGTHNQLINNKKHYYNMYMKQFK